MSHPENAELLAGIIAHPEDDDRRLVYADWLEDNDDPELAGFIRPGSARRLLAGRRGVPRPGRAGGGGRVGDRRPQRQPSRHATGRQFLRRLAVRRLSARLPVLRERAGRRSATAPPAIPAAVPRRAEPLRSAHDLAQGCVSAIGAAASSRCSWPRPRQGISGGLYACTIPDDEIPPASWRGSRPHRSRAVCIGSTFTAAASRRRKSEPWRLRACSAG